MNALPRLTSTWYDTYIVLSDPQIYMVFFFGLWKVSCHTNKMSLPIPTCEHVTQCNANVQHVQRHGSARHSIFLSWWERLWICFFAFPPLETAEKAELLRVPRYMHTFV
jgi:hypothetical protein